MNSSSDVSSLSDPGPRPSGLLRRPRALLAMSLAAAVAIGWAWLAAAVAVMVPTTDMTTLGPGMGVFNLFNNFAGLPEPARRALAVICTPEAGHFGMPGEGPWGPADVAVVFAMWMTMTLAMMLPSAAPMLAAYADRAEAARGRGEVAGSPLLVAAGYLAVWTAFAVFATALQAALTALGTLTPAMTLASQTLAGTVLIGAGLYQFTPLKQACLIRCRVPATALAEGWQARPAAVFRFGIDQGISCFGCCWALMAVMLAVGLMNLVWIALLAVVMTVEKIAARRSFSAAIGIVLVAWGLALVAASPAGTALLARIGLG